MHLVNVGGGQTDEEDEDSTGQRKKNVAHGPSQSTGVRDQRHSKQPQTTRYADGTETEEERKGHTTSRDTDRWNTTDGGGTSHISAS